MKKIIQKFKDNSTNLNLVKIKTLCLKFL